MDPNRLLIAMNEALNKLFACGFEVQKIVKSKWYRQAESFSRKHKEVLQLEQL